MSVWYQLFPVTRSASLLTSESSCVAEVLDDRDGERGEADARRVAPALPTPALALALTLAPPTQLDGTFTAQRLW